MAHYVEYDVLAMDAMLAGDQRRLEALSAHAKGCYPCPDCGHEGPHSVQSDGCGGREYSCTGCGKQHPVPPVPVPSRRSR